MEISLSQLDPGDKGILLRITNDALAARLKGFGFTPGSEVSVCYRSPGGNVTALEAKHTTVALRSCALRWIWVKTDE